MISSRKLTINWGRSNLTSIQYFMFSAICRESTELPDGLAPGPLLDCLFVGSTQLVSLCVGVFQSVFSTTVSSDVSSNGGGDESLDMSGEHVLFTQEVDGLGEIVFVYGGE